MKSITINTGEKVEIKNTDGEVTGYFYFNPADPDLYRRANLVQKNMDDIINKVNADTKIEDIEKLNADIRKQAEILLGESASDTLFKYNTPLSVTADGKIYAFLVFDVIFEFIKNEIGDRAKKVKSEMDKYTRKYEDGGVESSEISEN